MQLEDDSASQPVSSSPLPLGRIRVLELGHIVAGPSAGLILADLGADVIKIESPEGGDQGRSTMAHSYLFFNRNKRSLTLDLKSSEGKALFFRLAESADVILDNYSPGVTERLGVSFEDIERVNPRIIYLSIKGYLPGPYFERPSLDELAQMMGGLAYMTGPAGRPLRAGASIIDVGAATYGVIGVLAALLERSLTGSGQKITSGLFETSVFWVGQWMALAGMEHSPSVPMPERGQGARTGWAVYELFDCADGAQLFVGVTSEAQWLRFCETFGLDELARDERLASNISRIKEREWLIPQLREVLQHYSSEELCKLLEQANVPFAPLQRPDELLVDKHLLGSGQLLTTPVPGTEPAGLPKLPYRSEHYDFDLRRPPPGLGEHSREILESIGVSASEIENLLERRIVTEGVGLDEEWTRARK